MTTNYRNDDNDNELNEEWQAYEAWCKTQPSLSPESKVRAWILSEWNIPQGWDFV